MLTSYRVLLHLTGRTFLAHEHETVLAAAERNAIWLPASCRKGTCRSCEARLVSGEAVTRAEVPAGASEPGVVRLCVTLARSDLVVDIEELGAPPPMPVRRLPARLVSEDVTGDATPQAVFRLPASITATIAIGVTLRSRRPQASMRR